MGQTSPKHLNDHRPPAAKRPIALLVAGACALVAVILAASGVFQTSAKGAEPVVAAVAPEAQTEESADTETTSTEADSEVAEETTSADASGQADEPEACESEPLSITPMMYASYDHGAKPVSHTKYIVLHDTEEWLDAAGIAEFWQTRNNAEVATHFVVGRDGEVVQCVPLDRVAYHAGSGDDGALARFGIDSGMNLWSIGIEICHVGGQEDYTEAQLDALDRLIAHIDEWAGTELEIIDHKMWRSSNSDTSAEFAGHLASYRETRRHA